MMHFDGNSGGDTEARQALEALIEARREDYAGLSRLIGRNAAYIQQFVKRGTPKRLSEADRETLARYFNVPESLLGGKAEPAPVDFFAVPRLDIGASAGPGSLDIAEQAREQIGFPPRLLRDLGARDPKALSLIRVTGDSMRPTLGDGDDILVDRSDAATALRDGIYVLRIEDALLVKRVALGPAGRIAIRSDNPDHPSWEDQDKADLTIVGRVIWAGRRL